MAANARIYEGSIVKVPSARTPRNPMHEAARLVQIVLKMRSVGLEFCRSEPYLASAVPQYLACGFESWRFEGLGVT
eukprot:807941-Rhodomonas_salina.2